MLLIANKSAATDQQITHRRQLYALVPDIETYASISLVQVEQFCALAGIAVCPIIGMSDSATRDAFARYYGADLQSGPQRESFLMPYKATRAGRAAYRQAQRKYDEAGKWTIRPYRHGNITQA